jgi:DNA-binding response OmpR family regulator
VPQFLVVDDELSVCDAVRDAFEDWFGAEVDCAQSRTAGIQFMAVTQYEFALIDVTLPDGSGLALAGVAADKNVAVLVTSANGNEHAALAEIELPFLKKPFTLQALYADTDLVLQDTANNIRRVRASFSKLQDNVAALKSLVTESRRLLDEAKTLMSSPRTSPYSRKRP